LVIVLLGVIVDRRQAAATPVVAAE